MATATVKLKPVIQPIESVTLTLNEDEVRTLIAVLNFVGGCPSNSPRKHADAIYIALRDATKINAGGLNYDNLISLMQRQPGGIIFKDYKDHVKGEC